MSSQPYCWECGCLREYCDCDSDGTRSAETACPAPVPKDCQARAGTASPTPRAEDDELIERRKAFLARLRSGMFLMGLVCLVMAVTASLWGLGAFVLIGGSWLWEYRVTPSGEAE